MVLSDGCFAIDEAWLDLYLLNREKNKVDPVDFCYSQRGFLRFVFLSLYLLNWDLHDWIKITVKAIKTTSNMVT